jgi:hypothetical protein
MMRSKGTLGFLDAPLLTDGRKPAIMARTREIKMREERGSNYVRLAIGAGVLAAAAVGLAVFVPRRRWVAIAEPFRGLVKSPMAMAATAWAAGLWAEATQSGPPVFNDMRPFDEF